MAWSMRAVAVDGSLSSATAHEMFELTGSVQYACGVSQGERSVLTLGEDLEVTIPQSTACGQHLHIR